MGLRKWVLEAAVPAEGEVTGWGRATGTGLQQASRLG